LSEEDEPCAYELERASAVAQVPVGELEGPENVAAHLYDAATCLEATHRPGVALTLYGVIVNEAPRHPLARPAIEALIRIHLGLVQFIEAASLMEHYAELYPASQEASALLERAFGLRIALQDPVGAERVFSRLRRLYAARNPAGLAELFWSLGAFASTDDERYAHAETYLRTYAAAGAHDRRAVALTILAEIDRRRSCPVPELHGLCVRAPESAKFDTKRYCSAPSSLAPVRRSKELASAATKRSREVLELASTHGAELPTSDPGRQQAYADAVSASRIAIVDQGFERGLEERAPTGLTLHVDAALEQRDPARYRRLEKKRKASIKRLLTFITRVRESQGALHRDYLQVTSQPSAGAGLLASWRVAQVYEQAMSVLDGVEIPAVVGEDAQLREVYCGALEDMNAGILVELRGALEVCVGRARMMGYTDASSRACEAALVRLDRRRYPPLLEFYGVPLPQADVAPRSVGVQPYPPLLGDA